MALKYVCTGCGSEIITKFLKIGEVAKCRSCGTEVIVPENAEEIKIDEEEGKIHPSNKSREKQEGGSTSTGRGSGAKWAIAALVAVALVVGYNIYRTYERQAVKTKLADLYSEAPAYPKILPNTGVSRELIIQQEILKTALFIEEGETKLSVKTAAAQANELLREIKDLEVRTRSEFGFTNFNPFMPPTPDMDTLRAFVRRNRAWNKAFTDTVRRDRYLSNFFKELIRRETEYRPEVRYLDLENLNYNGAVVRDHIAGEFGPQFRLP